MITETQQRLLHMFSSLSFDEKRHLYFWNDVQIPKSVSGKVAEHYAPFEEKKVIYGSARKLNVTVPELRRTWHKTSKDACEMGTETHNFMENFSGIETGDSPQKKAGVQFLIDYSDKYEIVSRELRMYSRKYNFAGTADLLLLNKQTGKLVLGDYKTNKDLFKTYKWLLPPFDSLECHPYNKYQLQLSYYQIMLNEIGLHISERLLIYLKPDGTYRVFELLDFTQELTEYLNSKQ